jgi:hypothetical protein
VAKADVMVAWAQAGDLVTKCWLFSVFRRDEGMRFSGVLWDGVVIFGIVWHWFYGRGMLVSCEAGSWEARRGSLVWDFRLENGQVL